MAATGLRSAAPGETKRLLGRFDGDPCGPTLIVLGGLHGNEPAGVKALERVSEYLRSIGREINGRVYLLSGNIGALGKGVRFQDSDLNRIWTRLNILRNSLRPNGNECREDLEQFELLRIFREILSSAVDEVFVLDLHSTSAAGAPFATVGDTMRNRRFAMAFPVTIMLGIEEQLEGTLLEFLNNEGAVTLGFEGGQHDAESTVDTHESLVMAALVATGIVRIQRMPEYRFHLERLKKAAGEARMIEVRHREAVLPEDHFEMLPGFKNFDPVAKGQPLAKNRRGIISAPETGLITMPLYQKLGEDGFFIARGVAPFWLKLSALLRSVRADRLIRLFPGIRGDSRDVDRLAVNTKLARFFPLQIFHLLGYRKLRWDGDILYVSRRRFDTHSPFKKGRPENGR
jgi:predicted deacylase